MKQTVPKHEAPLRAQDQVGAWLDLFTKLVHLPEKEATALRDELEDHLRSRTHDLMIEGLNADEATRRAVAELGEAASIARSFRVVRTRDKRRRLMNIALIGIAAVSLGVGAGGLTSALSGSPRGTAIVSTAPAAVIDPLDELTLTMSAETSLGEFFEYVGAAAGRSVHVHGDRLDWGEADEYMYESTIGIDLHKTTLKTALMLISEREERRGLSRLAISASGGMLEVSTQHHFDARETVLRSYDVSSIVHAEWMLEVNDQAETLTELIVELVEPEAWEENGGDLARIKVVGNTMFISAPERYHPQVQWVMERLVSVE